MNVHFKDMQYLKRTIEAKIFIFLRKKEKNDGCLLITDKIRMIRAD